MVEYIVCNTFIYLSEHLSNVTGIDCYNTFLVLVTLLHYGRAQYGTKEHMFCNTCLYLLRYSDYETSIYFAYTCGTHINIESHKHDTLQNHNKIHIL